MNQSKQSRPSTVLVALATGAILVSTVGCAHYAKRGEEIPQPTRAFHEADQLLQDRIVSAMVEIGQQFGMQFVAEDVTFAWVVDEPMAIASNSAADAAEASLDEGVMGGVTYLPIELEDGTPPGFYAMRHRIAEDSNEGTTELINSLGQVVTSLPAARVIREGQQPRAEGTPVLANQGEVPRISVSDVFDSFPAQGTKKTRTETYTDREIRMPDGTVIIESTCTVVVTKERTSTK